MRKTKLWLIIAVLLMVIGLALFAGVMTLCNWDFTGLNTTQYKTNSYRVEDAFQNISIDSDTANIILEPVRDGSCRVEYYGPENIACRVSVESGTLTVRTVDEGKWYDHIGISFDAAKLILYLPSPVYQALSIREHTGDILIPGDFSFESMDIGATTADVTNFASATGQIAIRTDTGDVHLENTAAAALQISVSTGHVDVIGVNCPGNMTISVSTGDAYIEDTTCNSFMSTGSTGDITMKNLLVGESLFVERSTGYVQFDSCDAGEIFVETDTGDITGRLLSEKIFFSESDTGEIDVPRTTSGGKCTLVSSTGDIRITVP